MSNRPVVFLSGALRSGTTVVHLMLDQHPEIENPGEFDFLFDAISDNGNFPSAQDYKKELSTDRIFQVTGLKINNESSYKEIIISFVDQLYKDVDHLVLTVHRNFEHIPSVIADAKFIHLLRDPRDVARSAIGMGWVGHVYFGVDQWVDTENSWDNLKPLLTKEQYIEIKFEDLVLNPEDALSKICCFMGLVYSDLMLEYDKDSTYEKPDPSLVYQWKKKLSAREIELVEFKAGKLLNERGYLNTNENISPPSALEKIKLRLKNKIFRIQFAINRYGLILYTISKISQFLQIESLSRYAKLKKNKIDVKFLK